MSKNPQNHPKSPKNPNNYITTRIKVDKFIPGGQTIATREDGKKIFFWNALPDEIVTEYQPTLEKSYFLEAIATKIEQPSPYRISARDLVYLSTSPWQILQYDFELTAKAALLQEIFRQHQINLAIPPVITDQQDFYYRNKMEYALYFDHTDAKIHLAFHARGSHHKVIARTSSLERPEIFQRATEIVAELNLKKADARQYQSLLLRADQTGKVSGGLFENHKPRPIFTNLSDTLLGKTYSYSPNGFFQINLPVYERALKTIKRYLKTDSVLDLYAGVGTIGLSVSDGRKLTLVECDKSAYRELEHNCQHTSARPVLAKSEEALEYIEPDQTVILDPPRAGCRPELIVKLLEVKPPMIIYLSCNPATQARDAKLLLEQYRITTVQPFNFFPRTPHLENLLVFELKP